MEIRFFVNGPKKTVWYFEKICHLKKALFMLTNVYLLSNSSLLINI